MNSSRSWHQILMSIAQAFEPGEEWDCNKLERSSTGEQLAHWDLMELFFPVVTSEE